MTFIVRACCYGAILGSTHAHAKIRGYKLDAARAIPGVAAIMTARDFAAPRTGAFARTRCRLRGTRRFILASRLPPWRHVISRPPGERHVQSKSITSRCRQCCRSTMHSRANAPLVHEDLANYVKIAPSFSRDNVLWQCRIQEGDVDSAWSQCDVVVEDVFETAAQHHMYMEPCGALAEVDRSGRLTIWSSCQSVHLVQQRTAEWLVDADGANPGAGPQDRWRLRRQGRPSRPTSRRGIGAKSGTASQNRAFSRRGLRDRADHDIPRGSL